jgi:hypothetical protein
MKTIVQIEPGALVMVAKVIAQTELGVFSLLPALPDRTERGFLDCVSEWL